MYCDDNVTRLPLITTASHRQLSFWASDQRYKYRYRYLLSLLGL